MKQRLKLWESAALAALSLTLLGAAWAARREEALGTELIRLHIVAASDESGEQALKLRVREAVLDYLCPVLEETADATQARSVIAGDLEGIAAAAAGAAEGRRVQVSLGRELFPARSFAGGTLPAGRYETLRVVLGEGEGRNWWGLLFPQLGLPAARDREESEEVRAALKRGGVLLVPEQEGVVIRFQLLEWWGELLARLAE